jgi:hypothetical protein
MRRILNFLLVCSVAVGVVLGILTLDPPAPDTSNDSAAAGDPTLGARLSRNSELVEYKQYVARELVAGRMSLAEAADEFLRVNAEDPKVLASILEKYPGADEREKSAHNVIAFARARCLTEAEANEVYDKLAAEFALLFGHGPADIT